MSSLNESAVVARAVAAASGVAALHGLRCEEAIVISDANNVLVHLRPAPVVARVATLMSLIRPGGGGEALERELAVSEFLLSRGVPAISPSRELPPGPHREDGLWLTFWEHVEPVASQPADLEEAARALAELHTILAGCTLELPLLEPVAQELPRVLAALASAGIADGDLALLRQALGLVLSRLADGGLPLQVVHGDAHTGNLLRTGDGLVWTDYEDACVAPVAWDLACLCVPLGAFADAALDAYGGGLGEAELEPFLDARALHAAVWWSWLALADARRSERAQFWLQWWRDRLA